MNLIRSWHGVGVRHFSPRLRNSVAEIPRIGKRGNAIGESTMTQVTVGFQLGGQSYSEFIFFQDKAHLDVFKSGSTEFSANASAVAVKSGARLTSSGSGGTDTCT